MNITGYKRRAWSSSSLRKITCVLIRSFVVDCLGTIQGERLKPNNS